VHRRPQAVEPCRRQVDPAQVGLEVEEGVATFPENLTSSATRIRDVDMASEMVTLTKLQILQQAGTSMLAQANQAPQSVLSLLR
jgi:flagellin